MEPTIPHVPPRCQLFRLPFFNDVSEAQQEHRIAAVRRASPHARPALSARHRVSQGLWRGQAPIPQVCRTRRAQVTSWANEGDGIITRATVSFRPRPHCCPRPPRAVCRWLAVVGYDNRATDHWGHGPYSLPAHIHIGSESFVGAHQAGHHVTQHIQHERSRHLLGNGTARK